MSTAHKLRQKSEMANELKAIEKTMAEVIFTRRNRLEKLKKLKEYITMRKCTFRDKQLKKLIGEYNG